MNDLLAAVKSPSPVDVEAGTSQQDRSWDYEKETETFFNEVNTIKSKLQEISVLLNKLKDSHERSKMATRQEEVKEIREKMDQDMGQVNKRALEVKQLIETLDAHNEKMRNKGGQEEGSVAERTRTNLTLNLKKRLAKIMDQFQDLRSQISEEYQEVVGRRFYAVMGRKPNPDELRQIIDKQQGEKLFQIAMQEVGRGRVIATLEEIQERHQAVRDLEENLLSLHQMFLDMAVLVEQQGEMLDNIQRQVERSKNHVKKGSEQVQFARRLQVGTRKWMCCAMIVILIIAAIIVIGFQVVVN